MRKLIILICVLFSSIIVSEEQKTPNYNNFIPPEIMTPDEVKTRIGTLEFFDGLPNENTVKLLYDNLDFIRGVNAFLNFVPAASLESVRVGHKKYGVQNSNQVVIFESLMDSNPLWLTGNTDTVYASTFIDLRKNGLTVIEIPPGMGPGTVNDAYFRYIIDMGTPGPDKGKGGKYLLVPPDFKGEVPKGYYVAKTSSYINWLILRGFLKDGSTDYSVNLLKNGLKIYPYSTKDNPEKMEFIDVSGLPVNTIHANNYMFFEELNDVIQREPVDFISPELRGILSSIGMEKGKSFSPDERLKNILTDSVAVANGTARSLAFSPREKDAYIYPDLYWQTAFVGNDYRWLKDNGTGGRFLDARTLYFYIATVNTPAMQAKIPGVGSQYAYLAVDESKNYLHGSKKYKLTLPANIPAKDFWSIVVYDPQTRSELQTSQPFPSKNNKRNTDLKFNSDGSIDLFFSPEAPDKMKSNWIQTVPNKGWFLLLRLYGPTNAYFDQTWKPGNLTLIE